VSDASAFELLCPGVQKTIYDKGWTGLHPIQTESIRAIYQSADHLLISAQTAGGKTEAAFLPIISKIAEKSTPSVQALYVGPLKALINDQFRRMEELCENLDIPVHRWHGDVGASEKLSVIRQPSGILLITPESLEAIFLRRGKSVPQLFSALEYIVVDELHSFLDNVRGIHLQSLFSRISSQAGCQPRMAGLSATLGDYDAAKRFLDIDHPDRVRLIENPTNTRQIRLTVKAFIRPQCTEDEEKRVQFFGVPLEKIPGLVSRVKPAHILSGAPLKGLLTQEELDAYSLPRPDDVDMISNDVAQKFSASTNLVFCNSKSTVELLADRLHQVFAKAGSQRDPFVVHHASLSRSQRDEAEEHLKSGVPTTAICSSTLEMGIDISGIKAVGQVQAPWTVSSMVQRLGRSGRGQGESAVFRAYCRDFTPHGDCSLTDLLFPDLIQSIAMVELMLVKWLESPDIHDLNLSTLIHQILSHLTQTGGMPAQALFEALVKKGPFRKVTPDIFQRVLKCLLQCSLLSSVPPNVLIVGTRGEFLTSSWDFYAAFMGQEDFKVEYQGESIGKIPPDRLPPKGENLLLGGRRWVVTDVIPAELTVVVLPSNNLKPPYFISSGMGTGNKIARQMKLLLEQQEVPAYIDENAELLLGSARQMAKLSGAVGGTGIVMEDKGVRLYPWAGSKIHATLWAFAKFQKLTVTADRLSILYQDCSMNQVREHFETITKTTVDPTVLAEFLPMIAPQKFDSYLDEDLLRFTNGKRLLDSPGATELVSQTLGHISRSHR
jgi:ATP-dependent helicase Lhr and Lhr-like helicase